MEWVMLAVTSVASIAAVASAVVAILQARAARRSERDALASRDEAREARDESERLASEANSAFIRQAKAQERANEIKERELEKPPWSGPRRVSGDMHSVTNSSGRSIRVERAVVEPEGTERLVQIFGADDDLYAFGDSLDFAVMSGLSIRPRKLTIYWRFEDDPESDENGFIIPL